MQNCNVLTFLSRYSLTETIMHYDQNSLYIFKHMVYMQVSEAVIYSFKKIPGKSILCSTLGYTYKAYKRLKKTEGKKISRKNVGANKKVMHFIK